MSPPFYSLFFNVFNSVFCNSLLLFFSLPYTELVQILSLMFVFQKLINLCPVQTFRVRRSLPTFVHNSYVSECPAQVGIHCAFGQSYMYVIYIQESPFEIQAQVDRNPLDRSLTVPPAASRLCCRKGKFGAFQRCYLNCLLFFYNRESLQLLILKLRNSGSICTRVTTPSTRRSACVHRQAVKCCVGGILCVVWKASKTDDNYSVCVCLSIV